MTTIELRNYLKDNFRLDEPFPETFEVDAETYANVCQFLFNLKAEEMEEHGIEPIKYMAKVWLGKHNGVLFKGVELILMGKK